MPLFQNSVVTKQLQNQDKASAKLYSVSNINVSYFYLQYK